MTWEVTGADRETGAERAIILEADNEASAIRRGNRQGLLVAGVRSLAPDDSSILPAPSERDEMAVVAKAVIDYGSKARPKKKRRFPAAIAVLVAIVVCIVVAAVVYLSRVPGANSANGAGSSSIAQAIASAVTGRGTVTGSVWVTRKNGNSDIMRGVTVFLMPKYLSPAALKDDLKSEADFWDTIVQSDQHSVDFDRDTINKDATLSKTYTEDVLPRDLSKLQEDTAAAAKARATIATINQPMETMAAYRLASSVAWGGNPFFSSGSVAVNKTSVDGKYTLKDVLPGDYFVVADVANDAFRIQWVVPVTATADSVTVDLENGNAVDVENR